MLANPRDLKEGQWIQFGVYYYRRGLVAVPTQVLEVDASSYLFECQVDAYILRRPTITRRVQKTNIVVDPQLSCYKWQDMSKQKPQHLRVAEADTLGYLGQRYPNAKPMRSGDDGIIYLFFCNEAFKVSIRIWCDTSHRNHRFLYGTPRCTYDLYLKNLRAITMGRPGPGEFDSLASLCDELDRLIRHSFSFD